MNQQPAPLTWLEPDQDFPPVQTCWGLDTPAPGLLCAGADLSPQTLRRAYGAGIFPWFSAGQPILWWSPDPRMVLHLDDFRLHPSLRKTLARFAASAHCEIRIDTAFADVIRACATSPRRGQSGTWIVPRMIDAYIAFHEAGHAHSVEVWIDEQLAGGLYCVAIGRAVFGESMFHRIRDASKIALAALVSLCRQSGVVQIDCQQNTPHLASLGAIEIARQTFIDRLQPMLERSGPVWQFEPVYWHDLLAHPP